MKTSMFLMKWILAAGVIATCLGPVFAAETIPFVDPGWFSAKDPALRFVSRMISKEKDHDSVISASDERKVSSRAKSASMKIFAQTSKPLFPKYPGRQEEPKDHQLLLARAQKLESLLAQLEGILLPEPSGPDAMMSSIALAVANLRLVNEALPQLRKVEPLLVAYIESRLLDSVFAKEVDPLLGPGLAEAGARLSKAYQERESVTITLANQPDKQRKAIAALNISGQIDALEQMISGKLERMGTLDPATDPRWKYILEFLRDDLDRQLKRKSKDYTDAVAMDDAMRKAYWYAVKVPEEYETACLDLKAAREKLLDFSEVFFRALRPGTAPTQFLLGEAQGILSAMKHMDAEVVRVVEPLMQRKDREMPLRGLDGLFNLTRSIRRQAEALRYGQQIYSLYLLMDLAEAYKASNLWTHSGERSIWSGRGDFNRVKLSYSRLREYGERWRKDPTTVPLCALVETDNGGIPMPTLGGWLQWRWLGADDVSDFEDEGRVVTVGGRKWVVPPGVSTKGVKTIQDLLALGNISELVTVLDLTKFTLPRGGSKP